METENLSFGSPTPDPKLVEFESFVAQTGQAIVDLLMNIADNMGKSVRLFKNCKNPAEAALRFRISNCYLKDFQTIWPGMPVASILDRATALAIVVYTHLDYLKQKDKRYQSGEDKRRQRNLMIARDELNHRFPPCFCPPPKRDLSVTDSTPQAEWLAHFSKKPSKMKRLQSESDQVWNKIERKQDDVQGRVHRGETLELDLGET